MIYDPKSFLKQRLLLNWKVDQLQIMFFYPFEAIPHNVALFICGEILYQMYGVFFKKFCVASHICSTTIIMIFSPDYIIFSDTFPFDSPKLNCLIYILINNFVLVMIDPGYLIHSFGGNSFVSMIMDNVSLFKNICNVDFFSCDSLATMQALDTFNTAVVSPIYYVMFTSFTILASVIMFKV